MVPNPTCLPLPRQYRPSSQNVSQHTHDTYSMPRKPHKHLQCPGRVFELDT